MPWLIFILGLALAIAGGASVAFGYPYMRMEFGWTEVIAGTVALSGGIVTIGIGAVLLSLSRLRNTILRGQSMAAAPVPQPPVLAPTRIDTMPEPVAPESIAGPDILTAIVAPSEPALSAEIKAPRPASPLSSSRHDRAAARRSAPVSAVTPPTIAGRYESGGASYALFSDGTIEVNSETGLHRFGSMDELKSFMAREAPSTGPVEVQH